MPVVLDNFYAQWRTQCGVVSLLHEDHDSPPEQLLQAIWQHQRLLRDQLQTVEGQPVRILHPGFLSREGGPDFRGAVVQIGERPARTGDIEVDLRASGWHAHGHDRNPAFQNVILHVIWENEKTRPRRLASPERSAPLSGTATSEPARSPEHSSTLNHSYVAAAGDGRAPEAALGGAPPILELRRVLDAPLGELSLWLAGEAAQAFPAEQRGQCCEPLRQLSAAEVLELLRQAAHVRLRRKAAQFQARARQAGWEQSLWEGLLRGLGYKQNVWPMQRLAELRPRWLPGATKERPSSALVLQARLLGLSGLLPAELTRKQPNTDRYLRRVWDQWWRERDEFSESILPRAVWHLHGLRPANHPQRRLALAAGWASANDMAARLERWCARDLPGPALAHALLETLQGEPDEFWSWHWTLRSARLKQAQPLLGATRVTDLAINVVLPWLWSRAVEGKSEAMKGRLEKIYFEWPAAEDNAVLRLARQRLLNGASRRALPGAAAQQGLIQIVRDFCDHSNAICENCKMPGLVKAFRQGGSRADQTYRLS